MQGKQTVRSEKWSRNKDNKARASAGSLAVIAYNPDHAQSSTDENVSDLVANLGHWAAFHGLSRHEVRQAIEVGLQHVMSEWDGK